MALSTLLRKIQEVHLTTEEKLPGNARVSPPGRLPPRPAIVKQHRGSPSRRKAHQRLKGFSHLREKGVDNKLNVQFLA